MDTDYAKEGWKTRYQWRVSATVGTESARGRINDGSETEGNEKTKRKTKVEFDLKKVTGGGSGERKLAG